MSLRSLIAFFVLLLAASTALADNEVANSDGTKTIIRTAQSLAAPIPEIASSFIDMRPHPAKLGSSSKAIGHELSKLFQEQALKLEVPKEAQPKTTHKTAKADGGIAPAGGRSISVLAYSYCLSGRTASGRYTSHGCVAVDPRVIPLGSKLYIPGYGWAVAADTGGAIQGNKIDVWFPSVGQCYQWGVRPVTIKVFPK